MNRLWALLLREVRIWEYIYIYIYIYFLVVLEPIHKSSNASYTHFVSEAYTRKHSKSNLRALILTTSIGRAQMLKSSFLELIYSILDPRTENTEILSTSGLSARKCWISWWISWTPGSARLPSRRWGAAALWWRPLGGASQNCHWCITERDWRPNKQDMTKKKY